MGGKQSRSSGFRGDNSRIRADGGMAQRAKIESVAMESTGVYWIAPHEVLENYFEVLL
jgi:transposase